MNALKSVIYKELLSYFATPVAYVFIAIFLFASGIFTFYVGNFFERNQADLQVFFSWHPWLFIFLVPAISMRLWSEEIKSGTIEFLTTLPIPLWQIVLGKFFAAWIVIIIALFFTTPMWLTVSYLGNPDHGVIFASYIGSILLAGGYLSIGSSISAMNNNQAISFVITIAICFIFNVTSLPMVMNFFSSMLPNFMLDVLSSFSFLGNFDAIIKGMLELKSITYFITLISLWLYINIYALNRK